MIHDPPAVKILLQLQGQVIYKAIDKKAEVMTVLILNMEGEFIISPTVYYQKKEGTIYGSIY